MVEVQPLRANQQRDAMAVPPQRPPVSPSAAQPQTADCGFHTCKRHQFPRIANNMNAHCGVSSVKELWKHNTALKEYCREYTSEWKKLNLDVLLCPMLGPAFNIGGPGKLFAGFCFTMLFNILNFPAGVLPVTTVTSEDEEELKHYKGYYNDPWDKEIIKGMEGGVGLPVAVQCVALPWQEEQCLRLMKEVETVTRRHLKK